MAFSSSEPNRSGDVSRSERAVKVMLLAKRTGTLEGANQRECEGFASAPLSFSLASGHGLPQFTRGQTVVQANLGEIKHSW
jgi:hypothetical protein